MFKGLSSKLSTVKKILKTGSDFTVGTGQVIAGLGETVGRRIVGNQGVSRIGKKGIARIEAVHKLLANYKKK